MRIERSEDDAAVRRDVCAHTGAGGEDLSAVERGLSDDICVYDTAAVVIRQKARDVLLLEPK